MTVLLMYGGRPCFFFGVLCLLLDPMARLTGFFCSFVHMPRPFREAKQRQGDMTPPPPTS